MSESRLTLKALPGAGDGLFSGEAQMTGASYSIGRATENDWVVADPKRTVSKRHCVIERRSDGFRLTDSSTNGTTVNGRAVDRNTGYLLRDGDELGVGNYRFRVDIQSGNDWRETISASSQPKITAILHDVAPAGVTATSVLPGAGDAFDVSTTAQMRPTDRKVAEIGWDGPPDHRVDVAAQVESPPLKSMEFANRSQQAPTQSVLIDLPKPQQIIPDDWYLDPTERKPVPAQPDRPISPSPGATTISPRQHPDRTAVIPVENIDVGADYAPPAPTPPPVVQAPLKAAAPAQVEYLRAFLEGVGVDANIGVEDPLRFFHNVGRALSIAVSELHNLQKAGTKSAALLELGGAGQGQTPWIFSLSGDDQSQLLSRVVEYLNEAEPRDLEQMRADFRQNADQLLHTGEAATALIEQIAQKTSITSIEQQAGGSRMLPALRKAALWDAMVKNSGLYAVDGDKVKNINLVSLFQEAYKAAQKDGNS